MRGRELCRIAFSIDQEEQEITVYENSSLDSLSQTLTNKLVAAGGAEGLLELQQMGMGQAALKQEIKGQLQHVIEEGSQQELDGQWSKRLKQIIEDRPSGAQGGSGPITYFGHQSQYGSKQAELYSKLRKREKNMMGESSRQKDGLVSDLGHRLYDIGRQRETVRREQGDYHQRFLKQQDLAECTFHPKLSKTHNKDPLFRFGEDVFSRLYNEAKDKREKLCELERELSERERQVVEDMSFVPTINQSSKKIVHNKKMKQDSIRSIYQQLYEEIVMQESAKPSRSKSRSPVPTKSRASTTRIPAQTSRTPQRKVLNSQSSATLRPHKPSLSPQVKKQGSRTKTNRERMHTCESVNDYHTQTSIMTEQSREQPLPAVFKKKKDKQRQKTGELQAESTQYKTLEDSDRINTYESQQLVSKPTIMNPLDFFQKEEQKENIKKESKVKAVHPQIRTKEQIDSVFERRRMHTFENIFSALLIHSPAPQEITHSVLRSSKRIPESIRAVFEPMAQEMEQLNVGLDCQEFVWSLNRIFEGMSSQSRGGLMAWGLTLEPEEPMSFR